MRNVGYLHNHCSINEPITFPSSMGTGVWIINGRRKKLHWKRNLQARTIIVCSI